jgi:hypothetical protein
MILLSNTIIVIRVVAILAEVSYHFLIAFFHNNLAALKTANSSGCVLPIVSACTASKHAFRLLHHLLNLLV